MKLGRPTSCLAAIAAVLLVSGDGSCCLPVSLPLLFVFRSYTLAAFQPPKPTANPVTHGRIAPVISAGFDSGGPIDVKLTVYILSAQRSTIDATTHVRHMRYARSLDNRDVFQYKIWQKQRQPVCVSLPLQSQLCPVVLCRINAEFLC